MSPLRGLICALSLLLPAAAVFALDISLALDSIRHPAFAAEHVSMQPQAGGTALRK